MQQEMIDITPKSSLISSIRADGVGSKRWITLILEAVDNSFDANARLVTVTASPTAVTVVDDGVGITRGRSMAPFILGEHGNMRSTKLGRYGVGLTWNAIACGDKLRVKSSSADGEMNASVDWSEVRNNGWRMVEVAWIDHVKAGPQGTTIEVSKLACRTMKTEDMEKVRAKLARVFFPALADGGSIVVNDKRVVAPPDPLLRSPIVEHVIDFSDGRHARVHGGILANPSAEGDLRGVHVSYNHRVILHDSNIGCGDFASYRRMFARVWLVGNWRLTRFKDDIEERQRDELEAALLPVFKDLLQRCDHEYFVLRDMEILEKMNDLLPDDLQPARPRRKKEKEGGKSKGKKKKQWAQNQITKDPTDEDGPARKPTSRHVRIRFVDGLVVTHGIGRMQRGKPSYIELANDCPRVQRLKMEKDEESAAASLYHLAIAIYLAEKDRGFERSDQLLIPGVDDPYGLRYWNLLKRNEAISASCSP